MAIKVVRTVVRDLFSSAGPLVLVIPIFLIISFVVFFPMVDSVKAEIRSNPSQIAQEQVKAADTIQGVFMVIILIALIIPVISTMFRTNVGRIIKTANIEKRMEKLKKMGSAQFVKQTKATLLDSSSRGNKLYASDNIIKGRTLKFLIYGDKSSDREYISFVRDTHMYADSAMASKYHLSSAEYDKLALENEA